LQTLDNAKISRGGKSSHIFTNISDENDANLFELYASMDIYIYVNSEVAGELADVGIDVGVDKFDVDKSSVDDASVNMDVDSDDKS
ncbi:14081_t:CDS:1, partial [Entrophospora sp. SA101]